jgi:hypothetical protein
LRSLADCGISSAGARRFTIEAASLACTIFADCAILAASAFEAALPSWSASGPESPVAAEATAEASSTRVRGKRADLQCEVNLRGACGNLNLALLRGETKHSYINGPGARGNIREFEIAFGVSEGGESTIRLRRTYGGARQRLPFRFHCAGLRQH